VGAEDVSRGSILVLASRMGTNNPVQEPVADFNVEKSISQCQNGNASSHAPLSMYYMDVQRSGQLIACAMSDASVCVFDVSGRKCLSRIRHSTSSAAATFSPRGTTKGKAPSVDHNNAHISRPSALRFHTSKVLLGVATRSNQFMAYSLPPNV
jgi:hypothetical protein